MGFMARYVKKGLDARGRPEIYTEELAEKFCKALETSPRGIKYLCNSTAEFPSHFTILEWLSQPEKYPFFSVRYAQARASQADFISDEIIDVAYQAVPDRSGRVEVDKLKFEALKWKAKVLAPKKYCEKPELFLLASEKETSLGGERLSEEERIAKLNGIFQGAKERAAKQNDKDKSDK